MNSSLAAVVVFLLTMMSLPTFAQQQQAPKAALQSWENLKAACQQPGNFGLQRPPSQINVTCRSTKVLWDLVNQQAFLYPYQQTVEFEATSDKADVSVIRGELMRPPTPVLCPVVQQVRKEYTVSAAVNCQQVTAFQGTHADFCRQQLKDESPDIERFLTAEQVVEGTQHTLCSQVAIPGSTGAVPGASPAGEQQQQQQQPR